MNCRNEYENRLFERQRSFQQLCQQDDKAANFRTVAFFVILLIGWGVFYKSALPTVILLVPVGLFIAAVFYHESINRKRKVVKRAIEYYERCLDRLDGNWIGVGPSGDEFADPLHPYSGDLDIFGTGSLFQLLNSPVTPNGEQTLASWLASDTTTGPPLPETVINRQNAVRSLCSQIDLRERLAVIGPTEQSSLDAKQLQQWLADPGGLTAVWIRVAALVLGIAGTASLVAWFMFESPTVFVFVVMIQVWFVYLLRKPLSTIKKHSEHAVHELRRIQRIVAALETVAGDDAEIRRLRKELIDANSPASKRIHQLERTVSQFENLRRNVFFAPLAFISMAGICFAYAIDRWRTDHGAQVERWFLAIGELEALLAFSQFHFENPTYCFPEFGTVTTQYIAADLRHPLLPPGTAIANDVELSEGCSMLLVSGSNMSGKSTLMRSVGINAVLAWAGAPVAASKLKLSRLQIAAAMRMQDSLQTGTSHFFAELKRIQLVVELAQRNSTDLPNVLFLLDEILHGTNSHDRLVGAEGIIKSLLEAGSIGLVSTHDLALSDIVDKLDTPSKNVHFRDEWIDGKMTFDYRMRDGVVPKSNALSLMRLLGLDV